MAAALVCALLVGATPACSGTETGNPFLPSEGGTALAVWAYDSEGSKQTSAELAIETVVFRDTSSGPCDAQAEDPGRQLQIDRREALVPPAAPTLLAELPSERLCRLSLRVKPQQEAGLRVRGQLADGVSREARATESFRIDFVARQPEGFGEDALVLALDLGRLLRAREPDAEGIVRLSEGDLADAALLVEAEATDRSPDLATAVTAPVELASEGLPADDDPALSPATEPDAGASNDAALGSARILFPAAGALVQDTVEVQGEASAPETILSLSVNGVPALSTDGFATWSATVTLEPGTRDLQVGMVTDAGSATVLQTTVVHPGTPWVDPNFATMLDRDTLIVVDAQLQQVMSLELATGIRRPIDFNISSFTPGAPLLAVPLYDSVNDRLLMLHENLLLSKTLPDGALTPLATSLPTPIAHAVFDELSQTIYYVTGTGNTVQAITLGSPSTLSRFDTPGTFPAGGDLARIILDRERNQLVVADHENDALFGVSLTTGDATVLSGPGVGTGPGFGDVLTMALVPETDRLIIASVDGRLNDASLITGDRRENILASGAGLLGDALVKVMAWHADSGSFVFVRSGRTATFRFHPTLNALSTAGIEPASVLSSVADLELSPDGEALWALDKDAQTVWNLPRTGLAPAEPLITEAMRAPFPDFVPLNMELDPVTGTLYLYSEANGTRAIYRYEAAAGLSLIADLDGLGISVGALRSRIALDAPNNRLLFLEEETGIQAIRALDLTSFDLNLVDAFLSSSGGSFASVFDLRVRAGSGQLLLAEQPAGIVAYDLGGSGRQDIEMLDASGPAVSKHSSLRLASDESYAIVAAGEGLYRYALPSGTRTRLAETELLGEGWPLLNASAMAYDEAKGLAYVADGSQTAIIAVQQATGDRVLFAR